MLPRQVILTIGVLFITLNLFAEGYQPIGIFLKDSVKTGEPFEYALTFRHPADMQVLFPDSTYDYAPFELIGKKIFTTQTSQQISTDSVILIVRTFEIDPLQYLKVPVFVFDGNDSITIFSNIDSVYLTKLVGNLASAPQLKENTLFFTLEEQFNFPYYLAGLFGVVLFVFVFYWLFGKAIIRRYKLYSLRRSHVSFIRNFEKIEKEFKTAKNVTSLEMALTFWKTYLAKLEHKPINTFTTTELIRLYNEEDLKNSLQIIDKIVYGGYLSEKPIAALNNLKRFSNKRFLAIKNQIQKVGK